MGNLFDFQFFLSTFPELAKVIPVTLKITFVALVRIYKVPGLKQLAAIYVSFARGTPMLVQIYLSYYGLPLAMEYLRDKYGWALDVSQIPAIVFIYFAFTFNVAAYLSETIRGAILAIDKGQMEAALSVGMSSLKGMQRIVLPQALAVALPSFGNTVIALVKDTSLAFMISVVEMMGEAKILGARGLRFFEVYVAVAIVYWAICFLIERLVALGEKRVRRFEGLAAVKPS